MKFASTYIIALLYLLVCSTPAQTDVSVRVSPERSQFLQRETISLSCEEEGSSVPGWSVKRQAKKGNGTCNSGWGATDRASCTITLYYLDDGVYWCQSNSGEVSRSINIAISDVILESPLLPVKEGSDVTLRCLSKDKTGNPSSHLPAEFYKDGSLISTESTGQMTIHNVNKSDEGFYKCHISGLGESPESRVDVRASTSTCSTPHLLSLPHVIIHLLMFIPYVVSTALCISTMRARARANARKKRDIDDVIMEAV